MTQRYKSDTFEREALTQASFGEWLKRQRSGRGLTQAQLAHQIGCAVVTLRKIESEERRPSAAIVERLAEIFEIPQSEHKNFLKYARGDWSFALAKTTEGTPWRAAAALRTNLPAPITSFIGREKEQEEVIDLLAKNRLVTLTGPGGIGKTRLSLQVGQRLLSDYLNGVWLIEFAPVLDPVLVPRTAAVALGLREESQGSVIDMLCHHMRAKKMLLILDNCEHLIEACMQLAIAILKNCVNVKILVTSREALGIGGEVNYRVLSLGLPDIEDLPSVDSLSQYEAVVLFIERAKSALPSFVVTDKNSSALAQICYRLEGIPLAIELAAAKAHVLSLEQIAQRLDDRFRLLTSSNRGPLERHQTLRAAIDWSYNLLSPPERTLLRRLSVFVGGWTLEAAESVCSDGLVQSDEVLNLMEQLINKSLVIVEASQGEARYQMLETIRQYASERLVEAEEHDSFRDRHLHYFRLLAQQAQLNLISEQQGLWLNRLETELDNIRLALTWAQDRGDVASGLHMAVDLRMFWIFRTYFREPALALENLLAKTLPSDQMQLIAQAQNVVGWLEFFQGNSAVALAYGKESERLSLQLGPAGRADLATARNLLVTIHLRMGHDPIPLRQAAEENLMLLQEVGDRSGMAHALSMLAIALRQSGDMTGARQADEQSLALFRECGDQIRASQVDEELAAIALEEGRYAEARERCEAILSLYRQSSVLFKLDELLWILGATAIREEDYARAKACYTECLLFTEQNGEPELQLVECLIGFAGIASAEKRFERAAQLLGAAEIEIESRPGPGLEDFDQSELKRLTAVLREELGDARFEALASQGRVMTMEQAVAYALEEQGS